MSVLGVDVVTWQNALTGLLGAIGAFFSVKLEKSRRSLNGHSAELTRASAKLELHEDRLIVLEERCANLRERVRDLESARARGA